MTLAVIAFCTVALLWLYHSYRKWPRLFGPGDFVFAALIGALLGIAGWIVQTMLENLQ